eukprot:6176797-Pleurochrysis_carterae.AAC.1
MCHKRVRVSRVRVLVGYVRCNSNSPKPFNPVDPTPISPPVPSLLTVALLTRSSAFQARHPLPPKLLTPTYTYSPPRSPAIPRNAFACSCRASRSVRHASPTFEYAIPKSRRILAPRAISRHNLRFGANSRSRRRPSSSPILWRCSRPRAPIPTSPPRRRRLERRARERIWGGSRRVWAAKARA